MIERTALRVRQADSAEDFDGSFILRSAALLIKQ